MDKMEILEEYNFEASSEVKLYKREEICNIESGVIPICWKNALCENDIRTKCNKIISIWEKILPEELSITITYLKENLKDVDLIKIGERYYLLYVIISVDEEILYYVGGNPKDSNCIPNMQKKINLPKTVGAFYTELHNGFYDYCSKAMGLVEIENVSCLAEDEWGILDDLESPLQIDMDTTYSFFETGTGGYVAIDLLINRTVVWFADDQPEYDVEFWDVVDEWITIGMEE